MSNCEAHSEFDQVQAANVLDPCTACIVVEMRILQTEHDTLTKERDKLRAESDARNHQWSVACGIRPDVTPAEAEQIMANVNRENERVLIALRIECDTLTKEWNHLRERLAQSEATWKGVCDNADSRLAAMREALQEYGQHRIICAVSKTGSNCTCGLAEALTSQ